MSKPDLSYIAEPLRSLAVPIADLVPDAANARTHSDRNLETIRNSLTRWGQRLPIVVQRDGMIVRAGNGRLDAAKSLGWSHLAALIVDDSSAEAVAFAIADNRTAELAGWDDETLASLLQSLDENSMDDVGFNEGDLAALLRDLTPDGVVDAESEWQGMPEFDQPDATAHRRVVVNFASDADVEEFFVLIGQGHTDKTRSIWHPEQEWHDTEAKRY